MDRFLSPSQLPRATDWELATAVWAAAKLRRPLAPGQLARLLAAGGARLPQMGARAQATLLYGVALMAAEHGGGGGASSGTASSGTASTGVAADGGSDGSSSGDVPELQQQHQEQQQQEQQQEQQQDQQQEQQHQEQQPQQEQPPRAAAGAAAPPPPALAVPPGWLEAYEAASAPRLAQLDGRGLANTAYAFALLRYLPGAPWRAAFEAAALQHARGGGLGPDAWHMLAEAAQLLRWRLPPPLAGAPPPGLSAAAQGRAAARRMQWHGRTGPIAGDCSSRGLAAGAPRPHAAGRGP
jgi:hypothetical protein